MYTVDPTIDVDIATLNKAVWATRSIVDGRSADFSCAVERFAVDNAAVTKHVGFYEKDLNASNPRFTKLLEEIQFSPEDGDALIQKMRLSVETEKNDVSVAVCDPRTLACSYGSFSQKLPSKIFFSLTSEASEEKVCAALMRVAALNPNGQQLSMPFAWFEALSKRFGLSLVAYASVLNRYPGVPYCSIFEEDKDFGSLGNYYDLDLKAFISKQKGTVVITQNSPFTEETLSKSAHMAEKVMTTASSLKKDAIVIVTGPAWKDSEFFRVLSKSKWLQKSFFLPKLKHYYENPSSLKGGKVVAKANSQLFILSTMLMKNAKEFQFLFDVFSDVTTKG